MKTQLSLEGQTALRKPQLTTDIVAPPGNLVHVHLFNVSERLSYLNGRRNVTKKAKERNKSIAINVLRIELYAYMQIS